MDFQWGKFCDILSNEETTFLFLGLLIRLFFKLKTMGDIEFRFMSKKPPDEYCVQLAQNMQVSDCEFNVFRCVCVCYFAFQAFIQFCFHFVTNCSGIHLKMSFQDFISMAPLRVISLKPCWIAWLPTILCTFHFSISLFFSFMYYENSFSFFLLICHCPFQDCNLFQKISLVKRILLKNGIKRNIKRKKYRLLSFK